METSDEPLESLQAAPCRGSTTRLPGSRIGAALLLALSAALSSGGCAERPPPAPSRRDAGPPPVCEDRGETLTCVRDVAWRCEDGVALASEDCGGRGERCVEARGCLPCVPADVRCDGETLEVCDASGAGWSRGATCDAAAGLRCSREGCVDLCARAAEESSYIGCEYWPVVTRNGQLDPGFRFAVAVANPELVPAQVVVERAGVEVERREVAPGALEIVPLPWVEGLRSPIDASSVWVPSGAYRLTSDVPVVVTQFNPLEYRLERRCESQPMDTVCHSYTNDASLLLPTHVLSGSYVVVSRATFLLRVDGEVFGASPGFAAVVATADDTVVEVEASAYVAGSLDGTLAPMAPGERQSVTLARGDVLQLSSAVPADCPGVARSEAFRGSTVTYCDPGPEYDLSGTVVRASRPVAVVSGHECTFVPFDRWACDHLEEQLFPVESLGRSAFVAPTRSVRGEPNLLRVVSASDDNRVRFSPPLEEERSLGMGEWLELELREGVRVEASGPFLAALFLVGQDWAGLGTAGPRDLGDPAMALALPDAQYRRSYVFLAPATYAQSWIDVVAPTGSRVVIDRDVVTGWRAIPGTGWSTSSVRIEPGVRRVDGARPFGLSVYGFGSYTSYLVPGGLDLRRITPPI